MVSEAHCWKALPCTALLRPSAHRARRSAQRLLASQKQPAHLTHRHEPCFCSSNPRLAHLLAETLITQANALYERKRRRKFSVTEVGLHEKAEKIISLKPHPSPFRRVDML